MTDQLNSTKRALARAMERRFGASLMPYAFRKPEVARDKYGREIRMAVDTESGASITAVVLPSGRIRVLSETPGTR